MCKVNGTFPATKYTKTGVSAMQTYTSNQMQFLSHLATAHPGKTVFSRGELLAAKDALGYSVIPVWVTSDASRKAGRGMFQFPELANLSALTVREEKRGRPRRVPA